MIIITEIEGIGEVTLTLEFVQGDWQIRMIEIKDMPPLFVCVKHTHLVNQFKSILHNRYETFEIKCLTNLSHTNYIDRIIIAKSGDIFVIKIIGFREDDPSKKVIARKIFNVSIEEIIKYV